MKYTIKLLMMLILSFGVVHASDFLMPNEAFKPYAKVNDKMQIETGVVIAKDIYLYKEKLKISLKNRKFSIKKIDAPKTSNHDGDQVYFKSPNFSVTLANKKALQGKQNVTLVISYQGCSQKGLCYSPLTKEFSLTIDTAKLGNGSSNGVMKEKTKSDAVSETDSIANTIKSGNIAIILLTFLGFGLLLAMTPCVFPMIPIISGIIVSQGEGITTRKAFALSVVYVLAMAVAYTIAGVLAGLFGANLQAALQTPWVIYLFSLIFVALALSMFGFYELKLPDALVSKVSANSNRGGFVGVAIMGFLSALIVGPCVAAPLAGALVYIGQTGDALLGGMALFAMSIGMGLPLIVVGISAGKFMPKPGAWMSMVSVIFGVMMLGVAIWMLAKVVDASIITLLYGLLGIGFAIYLGVFESGVHIFKKSVAVILFLYSLALFMSFLAGSASMTKPLGFLKGSIASSVTQLKAKKLHFQVVHSIKELDSVLAKNKGKKIMLDFSAQWCTSCKELANVTFADAGVQKSLSDFVLIRADVTKDDKQEKALSKAYGVFGPPAIIFFDKNLQVIKAKTIIGYLEPKAFIAHLHTI